MIGLYQTRTILISSLILAACGVSKPQRPPSWPPPTLIEPTVDAAPSWGPSASIPEPTSLPMAVLATPHTKLPRPLPSVAQRRWQGTVLSREAGPEGMPGHVTAIAAPVAAIPDPAVAPPPTDLPVNTRLPSSSIARVAKPWTVTGLPPLWRVAQPSQPRLPPLRPVMPAIVPAPPARVPQRRLYLGQIKGQDHTSPCLIIELDVLTQRLFGYYLLPAAARTTQWTGFEFEAELRGLRFAGTGVFLRDDAEANAATLTVSGTLAEDGNSLSGEYMVVGATHLQGAFSAERAPLDVAEENEAEWGLGATEARPTVAPEPEPEPGQRVTVITLPPPERSLYTEVDFLLAFPPVHGHFERAIYRFQGFEHAAVVGAHAWAQSASDDPNELTYFIEEGYLVGSQYGVGLPWYRVQFSA